MSQEAHKTDFRAELCDAITTVLNAFKLQASPSSDNASLKRIHKTHFTKVAEGQHPENASLKAGILLRHQEDCAEDKTIYTSLSHELTLNSLRALVETLQDEEMQDEDDLVRNKHSGLEGRKDPNVFHVVYEAHAEVAVVRLNQPGAHEPFEFHARDDTATTKTVLVRFVLDVTTEYEKKKLAAEAAEAGATSGN